MSSKATKTWKKHKACLTNHTWSISQHVMPLLINGLEGPGADTHTHTHK